MHLSEHPADATTQLPASLVTSFSSLYRDVWDYYGPDAEIIGKGAFGRVFKAPCKATGRDIAIKVVSSMSKGFEQQRRGEWPAAAARG